ncbi:uncharacterized protein LOC114454771 isoform X2 [Gouania willdenowi]|uniref:uncharacterized protein LOC114454771 isoform X2 n=1 Tax=Gouania willdenowi TaxID=441366 RepID=UPI001054A63C|nr:uncharacterized protein LOC114454771 isoform X2 [Gouania willdenowi]XP_028291325.1 uncharacterized protein LOC114454771 isoform X2 [Gouania willdenowi]XP_028291326.1 uncharacterized protein LOC114454771 isoform X2 [Gouania willdenowi]
MESDTFVLFRGGKRITLQDGDLSVENICRVFQVRRSSLYLTDDANRAIMPEPAGHFSTLYMSNRGHYEVHGEPEQSQSPAGRAPAPSPTPPPTFPFSFMHQASSSSTGSAASHGAPRARGRFPQKSFHRSISIGEMVNGKISTSMAVDICFLEDEATVEGITAKVQGALDSDEPFTLADSQFNEDCEGSRNSKFWASNSRKIYAISDTDFVEFQNGR